MNRRQFTLAALSAAVAAALPGCATPGDTVARASDTSADAAQATLSELFERMYRARLRDSPQSVSVFGLDHSERADARHRIDDRSAPARERYGREQAGFLRELDAIERAALDPAAAVHLDTARYLSALHVQGAQRFGYGQPTASRPYALSQRNGAYHEIPELLRDVHRIDQAEDADAWLSRLRALPAAIDQDSERVRADAAQGVVPPAFVIDATLAQLRQLRDAEPARTELLAKLLRRSAELRLDGDRPAQAARIIEGPVRAALQRQIDTLQGLRAQAVDTPSVTRLPDGEAYYAWALRLNNGSAMSATEIHRQALQQAEDYGAQVDAILRAQGLSQGSVGERYRALASDPRHRYPNTDAGMRRRYDDLQARVRDLQARLPREFGAIPNVRPTLYAQPPRLEYFHPGATVGSEPNRMYLSEYGIPEMAHWELANHSYHESAPGHHLQAGLALESVQVPALIRIAELRGYTEGWALYAERLAAQLGAYGDDPLGPLGHLRSFQIRAMQAAADTGLHSQGWTRERAAAYVRPIAGDGEAAAAQRVDRYCALPAQGLVYMVGRTHWDGLRARAQRSLGARFDPRAFHDTVLRHGAQPFELLEGRVDEWIAAAASWRGAVKPI
ncbi:DUF885 domain-containing protein [Pseudomonas sp. CGJS7]|uniref:DUF885 domain-containing protein n=1 Tax=Pseudomonas sp. CGJS7 TaxID=3109348 RepID=UPI00300B1834